MKTYLNKKLNGPRKVIKEFPWENKAASAAFLSQAYYYVKHSTRLLVYASSKFDFDNELLHRRLIKHAGEELSHEVLAAKDVGHLGYELSDFNEFPITRALYQTQYGMIHTEGPWSIFGYILTLEVLSMEEAGNIAEQIKKHHGDKTNTFAKVHAADDIDHVEQAFKVVEKIKASDQAIVQKNIDVTCYLYQLMFEECARYPKLKPKAA